MNVIVTEATGTGMLDPPADSSHLRAPPPFDHVHRPTARKPDPVGSEGDQYIVLKPRTQRSSSGSRHRNRRTATKQRAHPWEQQDAATTALPEVATHAGETATMGSSTWGDRLQGQNVSHESPSQRILMRQLGEGKGAGVVSKALRLDQEEETQSFHSLKIRRGIENARKKTRGLPAQHWKTPYEVDAPRAIMLPRNHPQETSSSDKNKSMDALPVEQSIWHGIEQLMAEAFSDEGSSCTGSSTLPEALVKAMSRKSLQYDDSFSSDRAKPNQLSDSSQDELEMAQVALSSFMEMLLPADQGDDASMPSLGTYRFSLDGIPENSVSLDEIPEDTVADDVSRAEVALNNFMQFLVKDVEQSHTPASLELLDLFSWTMRVNVDDAVRGQYVEEEEMTQTRKQQTIQEDLQRHEELRRQTEAEEAELLRLEEEGRRIEEIIKTKIEEARRLQAEETRRLELEQTRRLEMEEARILQAEEAAALLGKIASPVREYNIALNDQEDDSVQEYQVVLNDYEESKDDSTVQHIPLESLSNTEQSTAEKSKGKDHFTDQILQSKFSIDEENKRLKLAQHIEQASNWDLRRNTPRSIETPYLPRQLSLMSSMSIPTLATLDQSITDMSTDSIPDLESLSGVSIPDLESLPDVKVQSTGVDRRQAMRAIKAATRAADWQAIGGLPVVVTSGDESSIDPKELLSSGPAGNASQRENFSSTELQRRRSAELEFSNGEFSTNSEPMVMPSESKRSLKAALMYEQSEFSIDISTLPDLANVRRRKKSGITESVEKLSKSGSIPKWAAIGGRPIVMPSEEVVITKNNSETRNSPDTAESAILPSSFHDKSRLSSSGSTMHTFKTLTTTSTMKREQDSGSVHTTNTLEGLPDLKSLSDNSSGGSSASSGSVQNSPRPKLFAATYSPRGPEAKQKLKLMDSTKESSEQSHMFKDSSVKSGHLSSPAPKPTQKLFSDSFLSRMEKMNDTSEHVPISSPTRPGPATLPSSFVNKPPSTPEPVALPSSFVNKPLSTPAPAVLPSSFVNKPLSTPAPVALPSSFVSKPIAEHHSSPVSPTKSKSGKSSSRKKKEKKRRKKKKSHKQEFHRSPSQKNLVVSAQGDVFMDDVPNYSLSRVPEKQMTEQLQSHYPDDESDGSNDDAPSVTEVRSIRSAGDIHLGSSFVTVPLQPMEDNSNDSELSTDMALRIDELRQDGQRINVPQSKTVRRKGGAIKRILACSWFPRRRNKLLKDLDSEDEGPAIDTSGSNLCLLHKEDKTFDETPVLQQLATIKEM